jgi:hypothetical protein
MKNNIRINSYVTSDHFFENTLRLTVSKYIGLFSLLLVFCISPAFTQNEAQVKRIKTEVTKINKSLKTYKKQSRFVEGIAVEGTEATYYRSRGVLRKTEAKMYGETGRGTIELFYTDGKLIFAFERMHRYDTHISAKPSPKIVRTEEDRLYFAGGKLIKRIFTVTETSDKNGEWEKAKDGILDLEKTLNSGLK